MRNTSVGNNGSKSAINGHRDDVIVNMMIATNTRVQQTEHQETLLSVVRIKNKESLVKGDFWRIFKARSG